MSDDIYTSDTETEKSQFTRKVRAEEISSLKIAVDVQELNLYYGAKQVLHNINLKIPYNKVTAFIGPSGCGKSTLLRCFNRMNDLVDNCRINGRIMIGGQDIHDKTTNISQLRQQVGMVFQKPNPFPKSIFENVAYGLRIHGIKNKNELSDRVEHALRVSALWEEVSDRLHDNAFGLSGGQQQRLVIARAIAVRPQVLLLDEPASALDPISTLKIEELIHTFKEKYTVVIVTHNMQQASRVSDYTAFLYLGDLVEFDNTRTIFTKPKKQQTEDYVTGRYG